MSFRKKLLTAGLVLGSITAPVLTDVYSPALAGEENKGIYLNMGAGVQKITNMSVDGYTDTLEFNNGYVGQFGLGYDWGNNWRTEANYRQAEGSLDKVNDVEYDSDIDITSVSFNLFYDIPLENKKYTPYLGAGVGFTRVDIGTITSGGLAVSAGDDDVNSILLRIGTSYEITEQVDMYAEVVHENYEDLKIVGETFQDLDSLSFIVGARLSL